MTVRLINTFTVEMYTCWSLNESVTDKIRKYRSDYNNNPPNTISFIPVIVSTSGRLHSDFVFLVFLQTHRKLTAFLRFRSSTFRIQQCPVPIPPFSVLLPDEI
jgi:hypothetical protein